MSSAQISITRNIRAGTAIALLLVGSVTAWASTTQISSAVIVSGTLVVDSNVRKVQHPTGGIIGEIRVRDGDRVNAGDVVVRLDATITKSNLAILRKGLDELGARRARLDAERDDKSEVSFPAELIARASDPDVAHIIAGERRLFELRREARLGQKSQLKQRIGQLGQEIEGLAAQAAAKAAEILLIQKELGGARKLWDKNLYAITKLTHLEREATRLDGERAQLIAASAQTKGRITEIELQIVQVDRNMASEVAKELREGEAKIGEFLERKIAAEDQLRRIDIRAPIDGVVHQSTVFTVGGVITANGDPLMLIVPDGERLIIEARVAPHEIDQLRIGQEATLRFTAFNQHMTPEIKGSLARISADVSIEARSGAAFYVVRIATPPEEITRLGQIKLVPGMPVEAFIHTGERKVWSYLLKPLTDQFARTFREK